MIDAMMTHNATPCKATGVSPFYAVLGMEFIFPGWQRLAPSTHPLRACYIRNELRLQGMVAERLAKEQRQLENIASDVQHGSWVVYPLSAHERKFAKHPTVDTDKYGPNWSLPAKVVEASASSLKVATLGCPQRTRDVSRSACKRLKYDVPPTLVPIALASIDREEPRYPKATLLPESPQHSAHPQSWDELLKERQRLDTAVHEHLLHGQRHPDTQRTKRQRLEPENHPSPHVGEGGN